MSIDIEKLEALAREATPGGFKLMTEEDYEKDDDLVEFGTPVGYVLASDGYQLCDDEDLDNAKLLEATNPSAILALITRLREAEAREQSLAAHVQWRSIEEAEKYNGEYLLYGPELVDLDFNETGVVEGHWQDDMGWVGAVWCGQHDCWHDTIIEPTHFLPKFGPESLPGTSLARRDARMKAEALEELASDLSLNAENARENGYSVAADAMQDAADYALTKAEVVRQSEGENQ